MIAVLVEKFLEVPGSSVEGPFGDGSAIALPEFAEVALFFQEVSDVGRSCLRFLVARLRARLAPGVR
jgi:hypothetical protein